MGLAHCDAGLIVADGRSVADGRLDVVACGEAVMVACGEAVVVACGVVVVFCALICHIQRITMIRMF
jgi:hypothetical protein